MNAEPRNLDAALLAGGRSSRFGSDKAFLEWRGLPLWIHQLRTLAALAPARLWLSANAAQPFPEVIEGVQRLDDASPAAGPLGGLAAVLRASRAERVLVLAVDLPFMEPGFLRELAEPPPGAPLGAPKGAVPRGERGWEPLAAVYPRESFLELADAALARGERALQPLVEAAFLSGLVAERPLSPGEIALFRNINNPGDLPGGEAPGLRDEAVELRRYRAAEGAFEACGDRVAAEEPLEIRVNGRSVAVTMRTPGHDEELACGFLFTEGLIRSAAGIREIARCRDTDPGAEGNVLDVRLDHEPDLGGLTRHVFTSSSCGVCGKATIESVFGSFPPVAPRPAPPPELWLSLPPKLRAAQETFERTGGLHASAWFDRDGTLRLVREDVGRHNALDKLIGRALLDRTPLDEAVLLVSGRISFELMQKALAARIPAVAGISAPSSLAVRLARESRQTLVGFLREGGFNLYAAPPPERVEQGL